MNFNNLMIGTEDREKLAAFYRKLFGDPVYEDDGYTTWKVGDGFITVGAHSEVKGPNTSPGRLMFNIETADVKADAEKFRAAGATVIAEPYSFEGFPDAWIATFADPDGNYFQLATPMGPEG